MLKSRQQESQTPKPIDQVQRSRHQASKWLDWLFVLVAVLAIAAVFFVLIQISISS